MRSRARPAAAQGFLLVWGVMVVFPGFLALVPLFFVVQDLGLMNSYLG